MTRFERRRTLHAVIGAAPAERTRPRLNPPRWHELHEADGTPRRAYAPLLEYLKKLRPSELRVLDERMEATLREMGVTFGTGAQRQPWVCDLLPLIFEAEEWRAISAGVQQRMHAFELFLQDVYGRRRILREGVIIKEQSSGYRDRARCFSISAGRVSRATVAARWW